MNLDKPVPEIDMITFESISAETPTYEAIASEYEAIETALLHAPSPEVLKEAVGKWDTLRREYETYSSLVHLHFEQDTRNEAYKKALKYRDALNPKVIALDTRIKKLLLEPERRTQLEPTFGAQAFALWESEVLTFAPEIQDDLVQESNLESEYTELLASAEIPFEGETYTLSTITKFNQVADREKRHNAAKALWAWFEDNAEALDRIYADMTTLRDGMAKKLGFPSFIELGYKRMNRVDYNAADVDNFRAEVRKHLVPLAVKLREQQAARLGLDELMEWDEKMFDRQDNPMPKGDHDWMIERTKAMYDAMDPSVGKFFRLMADGGFLDLKVRDGKAGGGFCTAFPSYGMPYVYANFNGTKGDVEVLTHEIGHAYQCYQSRNQPLTDYLWPTYESCEIHSMGMEFLTWPHMEQFFEEDADRFRTIHLTEGLLFIPYGVAVDHFQHLVYAEPNATPQRRHEMWQEMEAMYLPWRQYGDLAYPSKGGRWQLQRHIYGMPFYYIDYTLAQTCALQFWSLSQDDAKQSMDTYNALCKRGGEAPFQALAEGANLISPFKPGCLEEVVGKAEAFLGA